MCGIAGLAGFSNRAAAGEIVNRMTGTLARRGPDGGGCDSWDRCTLGHRRLSIFDLSEAGRQPMITPDGRVGITFNGSIYNFRELRRELENHGWKFRSHTDTEVLLHGYCHWGIEGLLQRLRGMFAFGLWDDRQRELYLIRDRLGVKPLYYAIRNGSLAFSSTLQALVAAGLLDDELNSAAVGAFLESGYVPEEVGIYDGLQKLAPGSFLRWTESSCTVSRYWAPPEHLNFAGTFNDAVEETRRLFLAAVERRLFADVPVGALLSGGIDSSLVCWGVRQLGADMTAFTVGTPGELTDETIDAAKTAADLGIRHKVLPLAETVPDPGELSQAYSEPFACASALGLLSISRLVKQSATVLLTGDGGDDVFLGYPRHQHLWAAQRLAQNLPGSSGDVWRLCRSLIPQVGFLRRGVHFLDYATGGLGAALASGRRFPYYQEQGIAGERLRYVNEPPPHRESTAAGRCVLAEFIEYERKGLFVAEYMTKVDGATMWHGLEARSPFLDQDLWEFATSLPYNIRLHRGASKAILRELARRQIGDRVAVGRKRGFEIPAAQWMLTRWNKQVDDFFQNPILAENGWVDGPSLCRAWRTAKAANRTPRQLWHLFILELWIRSRESHRGANNTVSFTPVMNS